MAASWTRSLQVGSHGGPRGETPLERDTPQEIFLVRLIHVLKFFFSVRVRCFLFLISYFKATSCKPNSIINESMRSFSQLHCSRNGLRHAKAQQSLKACLWRDQKPSVPGSARPREGEQNPNPRRIQGMQRLDKVSKPVLWRDRSQACKDLLSHEKASSIPILEESKACKGSSSLKACFMAKQKLSVPGSARPREGEQNPNP